MAPGEKLDDSARYYSSFVLSSYDFFVLYFSNKFVWRCPTKSVLLPFFRANAGPRHMDVGVGTGYFPAAATTRRREITSSDKHDRDTIKQGEDWPQKLALVDVNPKCLETASSRIAQPDRTVRLLADVLRPLPDPVEVFDSISFMYLLHCLSGPPREKTQRVLVNLKPYLAEQGVLFGATILGKGVRHNWIGRILMWAYNRVGLFHNYADGKDEIISALEAEFDDVEGHVIGCVLVFRARRPKRT